MTKLTKTLTRAIAHNLNPARDGAHMHAGPAGPYACRAERCLSPERHRSRST